MLNLHSEHGRDYKFIQTLQSENLKGRHISGVLVLERRIILKLSLKKKVWVCGLDFLAQDRDQWCAVVNTVVNSRVP